MIGTVVVVVCCGIRIGAAEGIVVFSGGRQGLFATDGDGCEGGWNVAYSYRIRHKGICSAIICSYCSAAVVYVAGCTAVFIVYTTTIIAVPSSLSISGNSNCIIIIIIIEVVACIVFVADIDTVSA